MRPGESVFPGPLQVTFSGHPGLQQESPLGLPSLLQNCHKTYVSCCPVVFSRDRTASLLLLVPLLAMLAEMLFSLAPYLKSFILSLFLFGTFLPRNFLSLAVPQPPPREESQLSPLSIYVTKRLRHPMCLLGRKGLAAGQSGPGETCFGGKPGGPRAAFQTVLPRLP